VTGPRIISKYEIVGSTGNMAMNVLKRSRAGAKRGVFTLMLLVSDVFCPLDGGTQTLLTPSSNSNQQILAPQNLQGGPATQLPGFSVPANVITRQTTLGPNPTTGGLSSSTTISSRVTVGRGLPGMSGGPPLGGPGGATDPSTDYMNPPVVGPLFCDPAMNIPC
jgi:hypothetical protein